MSSITIRNLDPAIKERLRVRAAERGHSMEAEARRILQAALQSPSRTPASNLYERIRALVEPLGGADDLVIPRPEGLLEFQGNFIDHPHSQPIDRRLLAMRQRGQKCQLSSL